MEFLKRIDRWMGRFSYIQSEWAFVGVSSVSHFYSVGIQTQLSVENVWLRARANEKKMYTQLPHLYYILDRNIRLICWSSMFSLERESPWLHCIECKSFTKYYT